MVRAASRKTKNMDLIERRQRAIRLWLYAVAALIFVMVLVGGATRLTESGLSIVDLTTGERKFIFSLADAAAFPYSGDPKMAFTAKSPGHRFEHLSAADAERRHRRAAAGARRLRELDPPHPASVSVRSVAARAGLVLSAPPRTLALFHS